MTDEAPQRKKPRQSTIASWVGITKKTPPRPENGYLLVDLFCSVGGVSCAAVELGHKVVLAVDFDPKRLEVHKLNHPNAKHVCMALGNDAEEEVVQMIADVVPPEERHRLWMHLSPPCQSQSPAQRMGKNKKNNSNSFSLDQLSFPYFAFQ